MFLKDTKTGDLIEVLSVSDLVDPFRNSIPGRFHAGEEMGEPKSFFKTELVFSIHWEIFAYQQISIPLNINDHVGSGRWDI